MLLKSLIKEVYISIKSNKLRSFLTVLGTAIGICAVVLMVSLGQTIKNEIEKNLSELDANKIIIIPNYKNIDKGNNASVPILDMEDVKELKTLDDIKYISPIMSFSTSITYKGVKFSTSIIGTNNEYFYINNRKIVKGKMFSMLEEMNGEANVVIGKSIADLLFKYAEPIGQIIKIKEIPFTVVGVLGEKGGSTSNNSDDDVVIMPINTLKKKIYINEKFRGNIHAINITINDKSNLNVLKARIENILRAKHKIVGDKKDDFEIIILKETIDRINRIGRILSIFLASVASISLFVGSIGIMNMMLVTVTERTKEIGVRKAVGAKNSDILIQFLYESITFALLGSMIGIIFGITFSQIGGYIFNKSVPVNVVTIFICIFISFCVGIISGVMPAVRASKLEPIEALK